jgi:hypothetical protein
MATFKNTGNTVRWDAGNETFVLGRQQVASTNNATIIALVTGISISSYTPGTPLPDSIAVDPYPKTASANASASS